MNPIFRGGLFSSAFRQPNEGRDALLRERNELLSLVSSLESANAELKVARDNGRLILTDYSYNPRSRQIERSSGGKQLISRLENEEGRYAATLGMMTEYIDLLGHIQPTERAQYPFWENNWFAPFDAVSLYALIAHYAPDRYIEIGSGMSTRFARQAIRDLALSTRIVSIDPEPRIEINAICDEIVRLRMEDLPPDFWGRIQAGDLLFIDNSHRSFSNSDVTVFFAEVLPALQPGVIWGIHDIFLPWDYPNEWKSRFYNEQYVMLAYLLGGGGEDEILLPVKWARSRPALHGILSRLWSRDDLFGKKGTNGVCFWMRRRKGR